MTNKTNNQSNASAAKAQDLNDAELDGISAGFLLDVLEVRAGKTGFTATDDLWAKGKAPRGNGFWGDMDDLIS